MNKVYDAFGEELKVGDVIIFAVPLHCDGKGYRVAKGIVKEFTPKFVIYNTIKNGPFRGGTGKVSPNKVGKSFEPYVPNCGV